MVHHIRKNFCFHADVIHQLWIFFLLPLTWHWMLLLLSVPHFPHLWNKNVKVDDVFGLICKILWILITFIPFHLLGYWGFFPWFSLICYTRGNPTGLGFVCLFCFVLGTKRIHLFSVKPEMSQNVSVVPFISSIPRPLKMALFSKTKSVTVYVTLFHFQTVQVLRFVFKVLYSTDFITVTSSLSSADFTLCHR